MPHSADPAVDPDAGETDVRRVTLANRALGPLAELGYSRSTLDELAARSGIDPADLAGAFTDVTDLATECVRLYKAGCVHRFDEVLEHAPDARSFESGVAAVMAVTLRDEGHLHRLWYDLRTHAMYDPEFARSIADIDRSIGAMLLRVVERFAELRGSQPAAGPEITYAIMDGLFQRALLRYLSGDDGAPEAFAGDIADTLILSVRD
ncbi:TetR family transcriptional regulator C-terminal domain-containing protein [Tsukamurella sp. 8F]|uniref:TetR/AcrR family transcriptional regulator n=1 Tax=unclassified Tsukamurella TaxID=2633480 RepID=UPI0023B98F77|nr:MULTISPECIES: TetR family transcriptional regulator C-terminal domain-containing protein [unclassified Tsukamurella]MDF0531309.1 TetR family transcriptional regulator C-terminal domain-containing protein [Tsukamurella sp. 8J]MDF0585258.1 TetR family transcriptional regulator C-terminal domain-containing protein [Tsukamurella sp. 8F]